MNFGWVAQLSYCSPYLRIWMLLNFQTVAELVGKAANRQPSSGVARDIAQIDRAARVAVEEERHPLAIERDLELGHQFIRFRSNRISVRRFTAGIAARDHPDPGRRSRLARSPSPARRTPRAGLVPPVLQALNITPQFECNGHLQLTHKGQPASGGADECAGLIHRPLPVIECAKALKSLPLG